MILFQIPGHVDMDFADVVPNAGSSLIGITTGIGGQIEKAQIRITHQNRHEICSKVKKVFMISGIRMLQ
ncbi:hypothetical protein L1887_30185 [Cichorium endivia]|nr:hypothetical protein L1887_30185 [Cichorium endivia]